MPTAWRQALGEEEEHTSGGQGDGTGVNREGRVASGDNSESRQGGNGNLGDEHVGEKCDTEVYRKRRVYTVVANK